ncbi:MAG: hypothetical protein D6785_10350 [Planctomycetota bacterium]|nr:MAG: hypothetical protein D6785_10350 [Planctomycetota bacterium]
MPNPIPAATADLILDYRNQLENQSYSNKEQLIEILGKTNYELVKDYVTVFSWVDEKAVMPAEEIPGSDPYSTIGNIPSINYQLSRRSPININTASKEVLIAVTKDIGGRTVFTYNDINVEKSTNRQLIDSQSKKWQISTAVGQKYEEKQTVVNSLYVWIEPFNYNEAKMIAENIIKYRENNGAFDNFEEFYDLVDLMFAGKYGQDVFATYWARVGGLILSRIGQEISDSGNMRNPFQAKGMNEVLKNLVRKGAADCIKANFNPNAASSFFNPNQGVAKVVDKANLLYMPPKTGGTSGAQYQKAEVRQTVDFCFTPMGVFEITSIGIVESKEKKATKAQIEAKAKIRAVIWIYDAIRHTTQADFEANSDIFGPTQRSDVITYPEPNVNWEVQGPNYYKPLAEGGIPSGATQYGADNTVIDGRVELAEANDTSARGSSNARFMIRWAKKANGKSWSQENSGFSNYFGETNGRPDTWAYAYETKDFESDELIRKNASVQKSEGNLMPDGFFNTMFKATSGVTLSGYKPRFIWYRAGYQDPTPSVPYNKVNGAQVIEQGVYADNTFENIDYYSGVIEFWYKPDKDWQHWFFSPTTPFEYERPINPTSASYYNHGALDIFMGFLAVSHVREKAQPDSKGKKTKSTGTQLFVYRNSFGDLRATRIYYEIIGEYPKAPNVTYPEEPYIMRSPLSQKVTDNVSKLGGDYQKYLSDGEATGLKEYIKAYEMDPADNGGTYEWPPKEIGAIAPGQLDTRIKRGRSDSIIHGNRLQWIRAHEWHHFMVSWNDSSAGNDRLVIKIDNQAYLTSIPLPRVNETAFAGTFSKLNEIPGKNRDHFYVGSIFRKQLFVQSGVFKFTTGNNIVKEVCHGTIDDVYYFPITAAGSGGIPQRFASSGIYTNAFALQDKFSGGVQVLNLALIQWTAYLPKVWHSMGQHRVYPQLKFTLWLSKYDPLNRQLTGAKPINLPNGKDVYNTTNYKVTGLVPLVDSLGKPYGAGPNDWLVYRVEFTPGSPSGQPIQNVVTPALDDITLIYFLPQSQIISETPLIE